MGDIYCDKHHPSLSARREINRSREREEQLDNQHCHCKRVCFVCHQTVEESKPLRGPAGVFHADCLRCSICRRLISFDQYRVVKRKFYCEPPCDEVTRDKPEETDISSRSARSDRMANSKHKYTDLCYRCAKKMGLEDHFLSTDMVAGSYSRCQRCKKPLSESHGTLPTSPPQSEAIYSVDKFISRPSLPANQTNLANQRSASLIFPKSEREEFVPDHRQTCVANADRVAKLQRKLEEIQTNALKDKNCYTCGKKVYPAEQLNILNRIYHVNCFQCKVCQKYLNNRYQVLDGNPYCIPHFNQLNNMKSTSVVNLSSATVIGEKWKPLEQINTNKPTRPGKENRSTTNESDSDSSFASLCCICAKRIYHRDQLKVKNLSYHRECFRCQTCQSRLDMEAFCTYDGLPYCETHHKILVAMRNGKEAAKTDSSVNTEPRVQTSAKGLTRKAAPESQDVQKCCSCGEKVYPAEQLNILKRVYHKNCFKCASCNKVLSVTRYGVYEGVPYCIAHHKQRIAKQSNVLEYVPRKEGKPIGIDDTADHPQSESTNPTVLIVHRPGNQSIQKRAQPASKTRCFECDKYTNPKTSLIFSNRVYHTDCLKCSRCQKSLSRWNYKEIDGVLFCSKHYPKIDNSDSSP